MSGFFALLSMAWNLVSSPTFGRDTLVLKFTSTPFDHSENSLWYKKIQMSLILIANRNLQTCFKPISIYKRFDGFQKQDYYTVQFIASYHRLSHDLVILSTNKYISFLLRDQPTYAGRSSHKAVNLKGGHQHYIAGLFTVTRVSLHHICLPFLP